jgi:anti-sigma factor RsiW
MLHELENNEAVLLMYLARELPPDDMAEVEQLLASDAALRAELEQLRDVQAQVKQVLTVADVPPIAEEAGVRQTLRAMVRFQLEQREKPAVPADERRRRFRIPNWAYPFAAAAMLIIAYVAWWGFTNTGAPGKLALNTDESQAEDTSATQREIRQRGFAPIFSLGIDDGDMEIIALSPDAYDVTSMFDEDQD